MNVGWSIRAVDVITMLEAVVVRYGAPEHLRSHNGPEFIPYAIQDWLEEALIKTIYTTLGSPLESSEARWPAAGSPKGEAKPRQNGRIESFHDKLRDECLNSELFGSLLEDTRIAHSATKRRGSSRGAATLGFSRPPGSLRPELPSTPKPIKNNSRRNFRSELSHLRVQANREKTIRGSRPASAGAEASRLHPLTFLSPKTTDKP